jgi:hypothetical protein
MKERIIRKSTLNFFNNWKGHWHFTRFEAVLNNDTGLDWRVNSVSLFPERAAAGEPDVQIALAPSAEGPKNDPRKNACIFTL